MQTFFDKIYVISLISNNINQKFIKYQFSELGLDFEFIYGFDFYNFKNINFNKLDSRTFSCSLAHYQAVMQAYNLNYNNVLILEDDICFIKDKNLIYDVLNNIPYNCDFISFDPRFDSQYDEINFLERCISDDSYYIEKNKDIRIYGTSMYALLNKDIMKLYLDSQQKNFKESDHVDNIFDNSIVNINLCSTCLFIDQNNLENKFINKSYNFESCYNNVYLSYPELNNKLHKEDFFIPEKIIKTSRRI